MSDARQSAAPAPVVPSAGIVGVITALSERRYGAFVLPTLLLVLMFLLSFAIGRYPVSPGELIEVFIAQLTGIAHDLPPVVDTVVFQIRMPRVVAAMLVGAALAASGATYQGLFRNPLVSPDILGVSSGAGLGAALAIFLSLPVIFIQGLSFIFGLAAVFLVYGMAQLVRGQSDPTLVLVLSGVVTSTLLMAGISLIKYIADPYDQLPAIEYWLLGSVASVKLTDLGTVLIPITLGLVPLVLLRWRINLMSLGDEEARALGINTSRLRILLIAAGTAMTAAAVSISGVIGFVGLIVPHMARLMVGPNFSRLLPATLLLGAGYVLAVDNVARTLAQVEIPLGVLNAFIGAPVFLWLLTRGRRAWQ
ncbi:MAG: iron ABC transporter permease [Rhodospirillaceae bacterium]|nr:iron ABC transporter permease [Rhodospirillaceae bacterium]